MNITKDQFCLTMVELKSDDKERIVIERLKDDLRIRAMELLTKHVEFKTTIESDVIGVDMILSEEFSQLFKDII